jgi:hypothetical protein
VPRAVPPNILAKREFAPGLPEKGRARGIPRVGGRQTWELAVQDHHANRAGRHFDLRLGDPQTGVAHSWALPKAKLPGPGEKPVLAVQQGDHTMDYMDFKGTIPSGYGAGVVKRHLRDRAEVFHADPDKLKFNHYRGSGHDEFILRRTDDKKWLLQNVTPHSGSTPVLPKPKYKEEKREARLDPGDVSKVWAPKVDGAHNVFHLKKGRPIRAFSHRPSKRRVTGLLEQSHKVPGLMDKKVPDHLDGTIIRGEIFGRGLDGRPLAAETVGGMLNSDVWKSRQKQKEQGQLEVVTFDVVKHRGKDMTSATYEEKLKALKEVEKEFPNLRTTEVARTKDEKLRMLQAIREKKHPLTDEGVVEWSLSEGTKPKKYKFKPDSDLEIVGTFATKGGKYEGTHAGGILVKDEKGVVSRVGTGFTDDFRRLAHERPDLVIGRTAKITSMGKFPSGRLRIPSFQGLHMEKNDPSDIKKIEDETGVTLDQMTRSKQAHLTILTGGMGAGKSTWAKKHRGEFDLVVGTDVGAPKDGKYVMPSRQERKRVRKEKIRKVLEAHGEGKKVLFEGYQPGVTRFPRILAAADRRLEMGTSLPRRLFRVAKRSRQRGTSMVSDLKFALGGLPREREARKVIEQHGPLEKVSGSWREDYTKHTALNLGQAARDTRWLLSHPDADTKLEAAKKRIPSLANNLFYAAIPPRSHHTEEELADMDPHTHRQIFLHGYAPWKHKLAAALLRGKTASRTFTHNDDTYDVEKLWKIKGRARDVAPGPLLKGTGRSWGDGDQRYGWRDVLADPDKHKDEVAKIDAADLSYPILLHKGMVVDGIHRLVKAERTGQRVRAVNLSKADMMTGRLASKQAALLPLNKPVVVSKTKQKHIDSWAKRKNKEHLVSTNLGTVAYNPGRKTMHVEFAKGGLYRYSNVDPETYAGVLSAKASHGKNFHKNVKAQGFKYRRLV